MHAEISDPGMGTWVGETVGNDAHPVGLVA